MSKMIEKLMDRVFDPEKARELRSDEYKAGVRAALESKVEGTPIRCPYESGTAQADAYFAGIDEGHAVYRRIEDKIDRLAAIEAADEGGENIAFDDVIREAGL